MQPMAVNTSKRSRILLEMAFTELTAPWPEAMFLLKGNGQIIALNDAAIALASLNYSDLVGKHLQDLVTDPPEKVKRFLRACARSRDLTPGALTMRRPDVQSESRRCEGTLLRPRSANSEAILLLRCVPKAESSKSFVALNQQLETLKAQYQAKAEQTALLEQRISERTHHLQTTNERLAREVSERQKIEVALQKSQARFAGILDVANEAIISIDEAQKIILFNKGAEKIFGYIADEIIGQPLEILLPYHFRATHHDHIATFAHSSDTARVMGKREEIFGLRKNGEIFPAGASVSKLQEGDTLIFTVVLRDITARQEA